MHARTPDSFQVSEDAEIHCLITEFGYTVRFIRDSCLFTIDHWIPIGYISFNTFLQASRASSRHVTTI